AGQGRFEDAAARLYRAMELQAQLWLAEATGDLFIHGRCKREDTTRIPEVVRALPFCTPDEEGRIKLSQEQCFRALAALGHSRATIIAADLDAKDESGKSRSRWRTATEKRNTSILAHGVQPIDRQGFDQMKDLASEFLGFDLTREANPIPPMDPRWLEQ